MNYDQARSLILAGDIVEVLTPHGPFGYATKGFTGKYTHSGIAVWLSDALWMVEINGGKNHAIPLSQLSGMDFDVYAPPEELDRQEIQRHALESVRVMTPYGFIGTIAIGINEFFKFNFFIHWRKIIVCSGLVVKVLELAGWPEHSYMLSPTKLSKLLVLKLEVRHDS